MTQSLAASLIKQMDIQHEHVPVAGVTFHAENMVKVSEHIQTTSLTLKAEPENEYDPNAIAVMATLEPGDEPIIIGYIPKKIAKKVKDDMQIYVEETFMYDGFVSGFRLTLFYWK